MKPDVLAKLSRTVPLNNVGWFDVLDSAGCITRWLQSENMSTVDYAVWLVGKDAILRERGERVAQLLKDTIHTASSGEVGRERLLRLLRLFDFAEFWTSPAVFDYYLRLIAEGYLDNHRVPQFRFSSLPKKNPSAAVLLLAVFLDRFVINRVTDPEPDLESAFARVSLPEGFVGETAAAAPNEFVESMFPRVLALIEKTAVVAEDGEVLDKAWPWLTLAFAPDLKSSLLESLAESMAKVAQQTPELLDGVVKAAAGLPHRNVSFLLLSGWSGNGAQYSNSIIDYLLSNTHRLNIGYGMWSSGNGTAAVTRAAISVATQHCSKDRLQALEDAILKFYPQHERDEPKRLGYTQCLLLHAVDGRRIGELARKRLQELDRKFVGIDTTLPGASHGAFIVESPIPSQAAQKMTDDQWLSAIREYASSDTAKRSVRDFRRGGAWELSHQLETEARLHKERFARFVLRLGRDTSHIYFDALARGLVATREEGAIEKGQQGPLPELSSDLLLPALRYIHELPEHPCGRSLCSALNKIARRDLPDDILEMANFYAINGADPQDAGEKEKTQFGGDLVTYGINTTRGAAAYALGDLLLADPKRWAKIEAGVIAATSDRSWSVRGVAIYCLLALLNIDRDRAVASFIEIAESSWPVLSSLFVEQFLYYAVFSHYPQLRPILLKMLSDPDAAAREAASRAIAVASFRFSDAEEDIQRVIEGDEVCRAALATIAAGNLQFPEVADRCRDWLIAAFNDKSRKVHDAAARCFHEISDEQLSRERKLIDAFLDSPAFRDNASGLLVVLEQSVHRLPDVVCKIPERAVEIHREENSEEAMEARWWTHQMAALVLRLYEQTDDEAIRSRCLNVLDSMIELDFGNIGSELEKLERA
jgi:hypothetical protein